MDCESFEVQLNKDLGDRRRLSTDIWLSFLDKASSVKWFAIVYANQTFTFFSFLFSGVRRQSFLAAHKNMAHRMLKDENIENNNDDNNDNNNNKTHKKPCI